MKPQNQTHLLSGEFLSLPKAELHLHLEGSLRPETVCALAAKYGAAISAEEVMHRYAYTDFLGFIEAFKWVSSLLRDPSDYALALRDLGEQLIAQKVIYAEITLSVGVMLLRQQNVHENFAAIVAEAEALAARGLELNFIFDAVRQFGPQAAMAVVEAAKICASATIVAFGIGGDELSLPANDFRAVYDRARNIGLHGLMHAGEIGGPKEIRDAIEILGVERIGHGIAAMHDPQLIALLVDRRIPLEICPMSNLKTGALARQLGVSWAEIEQLPLPQLFRSGVPIVLSTDDPAMFDTNLIVEYENAQRMGLRSEELTQIVKNGFEYSFKPRAIA